MTLEFTARSSQTFFAVLTAFWIFSPSALSICARAASCNAIDSMTSHSHCFSQHSFSQHSFSHISFSQRSLYITHIQHLQHFPHLRHLQHLQQQFELNPLNPQVSGSFLKSISSFGALLILYAVLSNAVKRL
jgi:hypothetical protein